MNQRISSIGMTRGDLITLLFTTPSRFGRATRRYLAKLIELADPQTGDTPAAVQTRIARHFQVSNASVCIPFKRDLEALGLIENRRAAGNARTVSYRVNYRTLVAFLRQERWVIQQTQSTAAHTAEFLVEQAQELLA